MKFILALLMLRVAVNVVTPSGIQDTSGEFIADTAGTEIADTGGA